MLSLGGQNTKHSGATKKVTQKIIVQKEEIHLTGCCILAKKKESNSKGYYSMHKDSQHIKNTNTTEVPHTPSTTVFNHTKS